jgi:ribose-phosphate pyrophosphokinase
MSIKLKVMHGERGITIINDWRGLFQFPGGEWHLSDVPEYHEDWGLNPTFVADVRGSDPADLIKAGLWAEVADSHGASFDLVLPYLPAARADRGVPVGASVYARAIKATGANRIFTLDPHSSFMPNQFRNLVEVEHDTLIAEAFDGIRLDGVICPDEGAQDRAESAALFLGLDVYYASKKRDFDTGKLSGFETPPNLPKTGRYLVVDDICDGGGTFMGLSEATGLSRDQLALWVTHGIFSGKADHLRSYYRWIATTDSHPGHKRDGVATYVIPVFDHMRQYL